MAKKGMKAVKKKTSPKMQAKGKPKTGQEKKAKAKGMGLLDKGVPLYLVAMIVALIITGGYILMTVFLPQTAPLMPGGAPPATEHTALNVTLLYSSNCLACGQSNTMLYFFGENSVDYVLSRVDVESDAGKELAGTYKANVLPALLVDRAELSQYTTLSQDFANFFRLEKGKYVVVEPNLDKKFHTRYLIEAADNSCEYREKPYIQLFIDPYSAETLINWKKLEGLKEKFSGEVDFESFYLPKESLPLFEKYSREKIELPSLHWLCAEQLGKGGEYFKEFMNFYCDVTQDGEVNAMEATACAENIGNAVSLDLNRVERIENKIGLEQAAVGKCIALLQTKIEIGLKRGMNYDVQRTPLALIDCHYLAAPGELEAVLCEARPELEACKPAGEAVE